MARNRIRIVRAGSGGSAAPVKTVGSAGKVLKVRSTRSGQIKASAVDMTPGVPVAESDERIYTRRDVAEMIKRGGRATARSSDVEQGRTVRTVYSKTSAQTSTSGGSLRPLQNDPMAQPSTVQVTTVDSDSTVRRAGMPRVTKLRTMKLD